METRLTLRPGERGTKKLLDRYGDRLVRVRYRYDEKQRCIQVSSYTDLHPAVYAFPGRVVRFIVS